MIVIEKKTPKNKQTNKQTNKHPKTNKQTNKNKTHFHFVTIHPQGGWETYHGV